MFDGMKRRPPETVGSYKLDVISLPEELEAEEYIPVEILFVIKKYPEYKERIRKILNSGKAIGVRSLVKTPANILRAIHTVSVYSQENYIITWLPKLLRDKHLPVITESDRARANEQGENIDKAVETLVRDRLRFKHFVLIDEENLGITEEERRFMEELGELIYPLQIDYAIFRATSDNASERTEIAQQIIKALLIIGPVAHILEKYVAGIGKLFAASADDLLGEAAELSALRGSGFSWGELYRRSFILIPVFAVATFGAFSVEPLIESGHIYWGGVVFGLSAVALSLTTAIQSLFLYRKNLKKLLAENKIGIDMQQKSEMSVALEQDFTNPARLGLFLGAAMAPLMGIIGSVLHLMNNGWVLAAIGSTESIVAGLTVIFSGVINTWRFERKLRILAYGTRE